MVAAVFQKSAPPRPQQDCHLLGRRLFRRRRRRYPRWDDQRPCIRKTGDLKKARRNLVVVFYLCSLACMVPLFFTKDLKLLAFSLSAAFFFAEMTTGPTWS